MHAHTHTHTHTHTHARTHAHTHTHTVRQLEQQVKHILDAIATDEQRKRDLIRGDAVDKAEQLSECSVPLRGSALRVGSVPVPCPG